MRSPCQVTGPCTASRSSPANGPSTKKWGDVKPARFSEAMVREIVAGSRPTQRTPTAMVIDRPPGRATMTARAHAAPAAGPHIRRHAA
jgi:hypothetical protein